MARVEQIFEIRVHGIKEAVAALTKLDRNARRRAVNAGLRAGIKVMLAEAKARVPVRSGGLRASLRVSSLRLDRTTGVATAAMSIGKTTARMRKKGQTAYYAHMVIGGTQAHIIRPRTKPREDGGKRYALKINDGFARKVMHPGSKPNDFLEQAAQAGMNQAVDEFFNAFGRKLVQEGLE